MRQVKVNNTTYFVLKHNEPLPESTPSHPSLILRQNYKGTNFITRCDNIDDCSENCIFSAISCSPSRKETYKALKLTDRYTTTKELS